MIEQLLHHIQKLVPGFTVDKAQLAPFFRTLTVKKEELLLQEGEICNQVYFVVKGCLYLFYEYNNEKQVIHFALENWWVTDYKTFADGQTAVYAIAAMEDAEIVALSRENYETLLLQYPLLALYFNKIHERAYGAALFKQKTYATVAKEDFYNHFRRTYPELLQRIPPGIFASYMGVSLEMLHTYEEKYIS